jgi:hypothetical protein
VSEAPGAPGVVGRNDPCPCGSGKNEPVEAAQSWYGIPTLLDQREASAPWADDMTYGFSEVWRMLPIDREKVLSAVS